MTSTEKTTIVPTLSDLPPPHVRIKDCMNLPTPKRARLFYIYIDKNTEALTESSLLPVEVLLHLGFHIREHDAANANQDCDISERIEGFMRLDDAQILRMQPSPLTPLDIAIDYDCAIMFRLLGNNWFYSDSYAPLTLKHRSDDRYYRLRKLTRKDHTAICIFAQANDRLEHEDGFNLNIHFTMKKSGKKVVLPMTIDPDVKNTGGGAPPITGEVVQL